MRVFAEERAGERHGLIAKRGQQQRAIRDAFRARQDHFAPRGTGERHDRKKVGQRHEKTNVANYAPRAKEFLNSLLVIRDLAKNPLKARCASYVQYSSWF